MTETTSHVDTPDGALRGRVVTTPDGDATSFLGIPYQVVTDRFRKGRAVEPWTGSKDASQAGPASPQEDASGTLFIDERRCLNLNVWTPDPFARGLPVLLWIHGGLHIAGSNAEPLRDGARLAAYGRVVVVSINYRLGALGYLTLDHLLGPEYQDSGNLALTDIISALRWVSRMIANFGGNPHNVTVAGQSAGATMVSALLASPAAEGLLRRAIIQSGDPERVGSRDHGEAVTSELLELLDVEGDPESLLRLPWPVIIDAQQRLITRRSIGRPGSQAVFRPSIDGRLLSDTPVSAVASGSSSTIDLIVGTNVNEASGLVDLRSTNCDDTRATLDRCLNDLLGTASSATSRHDVFNEALARDLGRQPTEAEMLEACLAETLYRQPSQRLLDARAQARGSGTTRSYLFTWEQQDAPWARRSGHSLELPFLFRHIDDSVQARAESGAAASTTLRDKLSRYWTEFAATGALGDTWPEYEPDRRTTLIFDTPARLATSPRDNIRRLIATHRAAQT